MLFVLFVLTFLRFTFSSPFSSITLLHRCGHVFDCIIFHFVVPAGSSRQPNAFCPQIWRRKHRAAAAEMECVKLPPDFAVFRARARSRRNANHYLSQWFWYHFSLADEKRKYENNLPDFTKWWSCVITGASNGSHSEQRSKFYCVKFN